MARRDIVVLLLSALMVWGACSNNDKSVAVSTGHIAGKVTIDGAGVSGVTITASVYQITGGGQSKNSAALEASYSAGDGDYDLELLPGQYRIEFYMNYLGEDLMTARYPILVNSGSHITENVELKNRVPSNLLATDGNACVTLSWESSYHIYSYNIYRSPADRDNFQLLRTEHSGNGTITATDYPPAAGTYKYEVTAISDTGETGPSNIAEVLFTASISAPEGFTAVDNVTQVNLDWTYNIAARQYKVYRSLANGAWNLLATITSTSYADIPSSFNTYYYRVTAISSYNTESAPSQVLAVDYDGRFDPPHGLTAADRGSNIYLAWARINYDGQYNIYRSLRENEGFVKIDSTDVPAYVDRPPAGSRYYYSVSIVGPNGLESNLSNSVFVDYDGRLDPPSHVEASDAGLTVVLSWNTIIYAGAYLIYRSDDGGTVYNQVGRSNSGSQFIDTPPAAGDYFYKVSTETMDGIAGSLSAPTEIHFSDVLPAPTSVEAIDMGLSTRITWNSVDVATGYEVYRAPNPNGDYVEIGTAGDQDTYNDIPPLAGPYYYRIIAYDNQGHRSQMSAYAYVLFSERPLPPTGISAYDLGYSVQLSWNWAERVDGYIIYRSSTLDGQYSEVDTSIDITAMDWPEAAGHYYYKVQAYYQSIFSLLSDPVHVYFTGHLDIPTHLYGSDNGSSVYLQWWPVEHAASYDLYRGTNINNLELNQTVYTDQATDTPDSAGTYFYAVRAKTQGGLQSPMSSPVMVEFTP
jgi:fibronectin type 3 domain-containing protein